MKITPWALSLLVIGTFFWTRSERKQFNLSHISSSLKYHLEWDIDPLNDKVKDIETALSQDYSYLGSGYQCFAFISQDEKYVLKFFRHHKWRLTAFEKLLKNSDNLKRKKNRTFNRTFNSSVIAYKDFPRQTGLIYLHLNKTSNLRKQITLSDKRKKRFLVNLDDYEFIIQRKASRIDDYLIQLKNEEKIEEAKQTISSLLQFIALRIEKGYRDKDPHPIRNFGVLVSDCKTTRHSADQLMQIDIGGYEKDRGDDPHYFTGHEIPKIRRKLLQWTEQNYPQLTTYTENEIENYLVDCT